MDYTQPPYINSDIIYLFSWCLKVALSAIFCPNNACLWITYGTISTIGARSRAPIICSWATFSNNQFCTFGINYSMAHLIYLFISSAWQTQDTWFHQEHTTIMKWKSQDLHCSPTGRQIWRSNISYTNQYQPWSGFPPFKTSFISMTLYRDGSFFRSDFHKFYYMSYTSKQPFMAEGICT